MNVYRSIEEVPEIPFPIVTIGTFDGVHAGHWQILERLKKIQAETGGETFIFTFDPHPRQVLFPSKNDLKLLTLTEEKLCLLREAGMDHVLVFPFTKEFAAMSAESYIRDILVNGIGVKKLIIGYDHRFGNKREGNIDTLRQYAAQYSFSVEEIPAHEIDHINVSSTKIRKALETGDIGTANKFLGYRYFVSGHVMEGKKLGRQLGYPTANISVADGGKLIPRTGIYAVTIETGSRRYKGMMSIGFNPTTDADEIIKLEVNIFNFDKDIYGEAVTVFFSARLRDEEKFGSLDELKEQLGKDKEHALSLL